MLYKRVLTPEEIRTHYLRGSGFGASGAITADVFRVVNTSGSVVLATNGSRVGIGTTNPLFPLTVVGTINATRLNGTLDCTMIGGGTDANFCADADTGETED